MKKEMTIREVAAMGGKARAKKLSKQRRIAIARQAINTRWRKAKVAKGKQNNNAKYSQSNKPTTVPTLGDTQKDGG